MVSGEKSKGYEEGLGVAADAAALPGSAPSQQAVSAVPAAAANAWTPGPWRLAYGPSARDSYPAHGERRLEICCIPHSTYDALNIFARGTGEDDFDRHHSEPIEEEHFANARLIAAAPDLYEALRRARDFLTSAPLESGYCCCGGKVEHHNIGSGHSPVDELAYAARNEVESIDAALSKAVQP